MPTKISKAKTIQAIKDSIKHWEEDILNPLRKGRKILIINPDHLKSYYWGDTGESVKMGSWCCPLCKLFSSDCKYCPLESCVLKGDAYVVFLDNPCFETAQGMVDKLDSLLPEGEK